MISKENHGIALEEVLNYRQNVSKENLKEVMGFIPLMESEFNKVERVIGKELTKEAAYHYYDFYDMSFSLKQEVKRLSQKIAYFPPTDLYILDHPQKLSDWSLLRLSHLLIFLYRMDLSNHGYFEQKMKDKSVLHILKAMRNSPII
ncbi:hypothetical protein [Pararhodonellum marinum]|uniref:hypothetical protein n=1 Tax=Pararhodonellum marinum TaxID=2755358 RepID=UPI00188E9D2A|nr:hypothetical protein [Pararhodonellum marinum]